MKNEMQRRQYTALVNRFRASMRDQAKLAILSYMEQNPAWSPEELKTIINIFIRKYGLHNRYAPDLSKAAVGQLGPVGEETKVETKENDPDHGGTETAPSN